MIHAESIKAVQELLKARGIEQHEQERWGDYVARGLKISSSQAEELLHALDENRTVAEACQLAGISPDLQSDTLLLDIGRAIGHALGTLRKFPDAKS
jgi:hypothetical protein